MKDARSLSLSWHLRSPLQGGSYCAGRSLPDWLKEVRSLRGSVLFDNGRRRNFSTEEGRLFDADPIDLYAYHILAYDAMRLVGCVRVYPLISNGFSCVTEQILKAQIRVNSYFCLPRTEYPPAHCSNQHRRLLGRHSQECSWGIITFQARYI